MKFKKKNLINQTNKNGCQNSKRQVNFANIFIYNYVFRTQNDDTNNRSNVFVYEHITKM